MPFKSLPGLIKNLSDSLGFVKDSLTCLNSSKHLLNFLARFVQDYFRHTYINLRFFHAAEDSQVLLLFLINTSLPIFWETLHQFRRLSGDWRLFFFLIFFSFLNRKVMGNLRNLLIWFCLILKCKLLRLLKAGKVTENHKCHKGIVSQFLVIAKSVFDHTLTSSLIFWYILQGELKNRWHSCRWTPTLQMPQCSL